MGKKNGKKNGNGGAVVRTTMTDEEFRRAYAVVKHRHADAFKMLADYDAGKISR